MRMSFSRLAAVGAVLAAGVTLASCASSAFPVAASGPNQNPIGFPGGSARVVFVQGSPQLNLGVNNTDLYIDGKLAVTNFFYPPAFAPISPAPSGPVVVGPVTPYIELPIGVHDIRLTQHGSGAPVFQDFAITLKANTKYAVVYQGDAVDGTAGVGIWVQPVYNTANSGAAVSVFNASPRTAKAGAACTPTCRTDVLEIAFNVATDTVVATGLTVGSLAALTSSWKNNVPQIPSQQYCISAYTSPALPVPGPLVAGFPTPTSNEHTNTNCTQNLLGGANLNLYIIDLGVSPATTSIIVGVPDTNG